MMDGWMFGMGWGWLALILLLVVVVAAVVVGMTASRGGQSSGSRWSGDMTPPRPDSREAEEILKERYARGEITREEYREMREDIRG